MSLKTIELQIAIPRTQEAGRLQENIQNQSQRMADQAAEAGRKKAETNLQTVHGRDETEKLNLHDHSDTNGRHDREQEQRDINKKKKNSVSAPKHPYKGKQIDFSG